MIVADKPPLSGVYLAHFGVRGMKWGQRKKSSSSSSSGKSGSSKMSPATKKKFAVGAAVLGGAAVAAIILSRRGRTPVVKIGKVNLRPSTMDKLREAQKMKIDNFNKIKPTLGKTQYFDPTVGNTGAWRTPTSSALAVRTGSRTTSKVDLGNIADVRRAWADPNHVWEL